MNQVPTLVCRNGSCEDFYKTIALAALRTGLQRDAEIQLVRPPRRGRSKERMAWSWCSYVNNDFQNAVRETIGNFEPTPFEEGSDMPLHSLVIKIADLLKMLSAREMLDASGGRDA